MRVLVTGATGFAGSHAAEALAAAGHEVRVLARSAEKAARVLGARGVTPERVVVGDMTDAGAAARALDGCDAVLHAAAGVEIGRSGGSFEQNAAGVDNVIGGAVERGLDPILYVSSIATLFPPPGPRFTPDDPISNLSTDYGRSKARGEERVRALQAEGHPIVCVYPAGIYGPDDPGPTLTMLGLCARIRHGWFRTTGGVGIVDVRDLASILAAACERERGPRRYMAGGHFLRWMDEADLCERISGRRVRRMPGPPWLLRAAGHAIDAIQRVAPGLDYPLTYEAARFVTEFVPSDDSRTHAELEIAYRPVAQTLEDSLRWLLASGELDARLLPALAR